MGIFHIKHILFLLIQKSGFLSHKNFGYFMGRKTGRKGALLYAPLRPVCYNIHLFSPVVNNEYLRNCLIVCQFYIYLVIACLFAVFSSGFLPIIFLLFFTKFVLYSSYGALAQLGARHTGSVEVTGSSPVCSIFLCNNI